MRFFFIDGIDKRRLVLWFLLGLVIILLMVNGIMAKQHYTTASSQYREDIPIYSVELENEEKKCAITFDCAWGADDIPAILDILDKYKAKGTFFVVGLWAKKYPDAVELVHERGHEVANHGYSHAHMAQIPENKIEEEILKCTQTIEEIVGDNNKLFRPPYGEYNSKTIKVAKKLGYQTIQWNVDSLDWKKSLSKDDIYNRVVEKTKSGSIILFHNDTLHTEEVLPLILDKLTKDGFDCVKVSDLIIKDNYKIRYDGRQIRN